jgi:hypothetical protein
MRVGLIGTYHQEILPHVGMGHFFSHQQNGVSKLNLMVRVRHLHEHIIQFTLNCFSHKITHVGVICNLFALTF